MNRFNRLLMTSLMVAGLASNAVAAERPNILVIMADDVGPTNVGAYSHGIMAPTPNLNRIAKEGMLFTDHYAEPTCTAGRASFITGQKPIRTGLTTVGLPGSLLGIDERDPTLAEVLKPLGYKTAQIGKNHLGDQDHHLPTNHGFDEFFGNLYHLNAEEEPEQLDYPTELLTKYKPRGVIDSKAGPDGFIKDTGPLTRKRMETIDEEFTARSVKFMEQSVEEDKPFFLWHNPSRIHIYTHSLPKYIKRIAEFSSEEDIAGAGVLELDDHVGILLDKLDKLGIADNTIVIFTSDNGPMAYHFPDAGITPYRGEKATTWEGGVRVPMLLRWPDKIEAGSVSNGIQSHMDLFTTLAAAAGVKDVAAELKEKDKVHIDGVDNLAHWQGKADSSRESFIYYNEGTLAAVRWKQWKVHAQERSGFFDYFRQSALLFNLRMDPFEQHDGLYANMLAQKKAWIGGILRDIMTEHVTSLHQFPPRQKGGSLRGGMELVE
ncbi:arylsulfatase [Amphritea sp. HPY]|uniref:arylsulfatase n=1 Tax=Amphritea sp. HPY TaxID=3421652 RepID=UPI003D7DDA81